MPEIEVPNQLYAIQYVDYARDGEEAWAWLDGCKLQSGYLGGRVQKPAPGRPTWKLQVFFKTELTGTPALLSIEQRWLPDGCRLVMVPSTLLKLMGMICAPEPNPALDGDEDGETS